MRLGRVLRCSSVKFHGNCYISLSHLLAYGYRIRKGRKAKMIRKERKVEMIREASGGGGNGAES